MRIEVKSMADAYAPECFLPLRLPFLASQLTRMMARACRSLGLSLPGSRIVALLGQRESVPRREVLTRCGMDKTRLTRVTRRLRAQGYIEQRNVPDDRRQVTLELTPRGKEICRDLKRVMLDLHATLVGMVGSEEYKAFERVLDRFESGATGQFVRSRIIRARPDRPPTDVIGGTYSARL